LPLMGESPNNSLQWEVYQRTDNIAAKTIGITDVHTQLLLNALQTPIMMIASICGLCMIDKWGRRKFLITGSILMSICLSIITACTAQHAGKPIVSGVGIAFLYLFLVSFAVCWVSHSSSYIFILCKIANETWP
jgi:MFS family permease